METKNSFPKIKPAVINMTGVIPEQILQKAGYYKNGEKGYIRPFETNHRFHAYVTKLGQVELHTDRTKINKKKERVHIASTYKTIKEVQRIKSFIPKSEIEKTEPKPKKIKYKDEILPLAKQREALKLIHNKKTIWQKMRFWFGL